MRPLPTLAMLLALLALQNPRAEAQSSTLTVTWPDGNRDPREAIVGLNHDDDNDDGVPDLAAARVDPGDDDLVAVTVTGAATASVRVRVTGGLRLVRDGVLATEALVPVREGRAVVAILGVAVSARGRDAAIEFEAGSARATVPVTVVAAALLHGDHRVLFGHRDALAVSHRVTNDDTLLRGEDFHATSPDPDNVRIEVWDPGAGRDGSFEVQSFATRGSSGLAPGAPRGRLRGLVPLRAEGLTASVRSIWIRLVGDEVDLRAPGVQAQTLLVGLRDRVRASWHRPGAAGEVSTDLRVGRPGNEDGPLAARRARWNVHVLRDRPLAEGGQPVVGDLDANALRIARRQVEISNEIYLQCAITFGAPDAAEVHLEDPPIASLLAIGDRDGLRAAGGVLRFRAGPRTLGPLRQVAGEAPVDTAMRVALALRAAGLEARVSRNPRTDFGAEGSADVLVRDRNGRPVALSPVPGVPLSTDPQQRVSLGVVDLRDGLDEFNNLTSAAGTLEERTLVKSLQDNDSGTIDLFLINHFARGTRIGEAFVSGDRGTLVNALLIDRTGIAAEREAWTQSHEAGHILLDQPWHPDNMGPDRPWLLMDADASLGAVTGPKRISHEECRRLHAESGVDSPRPVLTRHDPATPAPEAPRFARWPLETLWPRPTPSPPASPGTPPPISSVRATDHGLRWLE